MAGLGMPHRHHRNASLVGALEVDGSRLYWIPQKVHLFGDINAVVALPCIATRMVWTKDQIRCHTLFHKLAHIFVVALRCIATRRVCT